MQYMGQAGTWVRKNLAGYISEERTPSNIGICIYDTKLRIAVSQISCTFVSNENEEDCAKLWQRYALLRIIAAMQQPVGYATHLFLCANKCSGLWNFIFAKTNFSHFSSDFVGLD